MVSQEIYFIYSFVLISAKLKTVRKMKSSHYKLGTVKRFRFQRKLVATGTTSKISQTPGEYRVRKLYCTLYIQTFFAV